MLLAVSFSASAGRIGLTWEYNEAFRADGVTPFDMGTELAGFKAYCDMGGAIMEFYITDSYLRDFVSPPQSDGTYDCVMTAIDTEGRESVFSNVTTVVLETPAPKGITTLVGQALP